MRISNDVLEHINNYIDVHKDEIIAMWKKFVDVRSDATIKENADAMAYILKEELEAIGCKCQMFDVGDRNGLALDAVLGEDRPGKPVLFSGHYDVVPLAGNHPFYIDDENRAHGLGCLDMKGGIVISIWIAKALCDLKWEERPIRFVYVGDEENAHQFGSTKQFLREHGDGALCAFNMETGLVDNSICTGRKGTGQAEINVQGIAAHSGNNFLDGRSAISEMMHLIPKIEALTDLDANTTVVVTKIQGGTVTNSVPPNCSCIVDLRFGSVSERERVVGEIQKYVRKIPSKKQVRNLSSVSSWLHLMQLLR